MQQRAERRHHRIEVYLPAQCTVFAPQVPQEPMEGKTRSLSPGGAMLLLPAPLPLHTRLVVRLGEGPDLRSRVVWAGHVFRTHLGAVRAHGIAFTRNLDASALKQILRATRKQNHLRIPARFPVACDNLEKQGRGTCFNLSQTGMFIGTTDLVCPGEELIVRVAAPGIRDSFSLWSRVMWTNPLEGGNFFPAGMGVRFLELGPAEATHLSTLLENLRSKTAPPGPASG